MTCTLGHFSYIFAFWVHIWNSLTVSSVKHFSVIGDFLWYVNLKDDVKATYCHIHFALLARLSPQDKISILINLRFSLSFAFSVLGSLPHCNATANGTPANSTFSLETEDKSILTTRSLGRLLQDHSSPPQNDLTPPVVTQLQPPMLPPPPYPSFKLVQSNTEVPPTNQPLLNTESKLPKTLFVKSAPTNASLDTNAQYRHERQTRLTSPQQQFWDVDKSSAVSDSALPSASVITKSESQFLLNNSQTKTFDFLKVESQNANISQNHPVTPSHLQHGLFYPQSLTKREFQQSTSVSNQASQTKLGGSSETASRESQKFDPEKSSTQTYFAKFDLELSIGHYDHLNQTIKPPVDSASNQSGTQPSSIPPALFLTTAPPTTQPPNSELQLPTPWTQTESSQEHDSNPATHQPSSSIYPSTKHQLIPDFHHVNLSNQIQVNTSRQTNSFNSTKVVNDTDATEWLKKNTSQSPMTSNDPRWEKQYEVLFLFGKCLLHMSVIHKGLFFLTTEWQKALPHGYQFWRNMTFQS